jgi:phosphate uptake regulator
MDSMSVLQKVRQARINLKSQNSTDLTNQESLEELFKEAQELISQMNKDKLQAIANVEEQYRERLEDIDSQLAFYVQLIG